MGQYFKVYNVDKEEFIHAHHIDNGLKLMEQVGFQKSTASALFLLLANSNGRSGGGAKDNPLIGRWAGDRIVIQGDYAEPGDRGFVDPEELARYKNISAEVKSMLDREFDE
jgi:hypothetical protein